MKQVKSYSVEQTTIDLIKEVASCIGTSDSVALELLISLGHASLEFNPLFNGKTRVGGSEYGKNEGQV